MTLKVQVASLIFPHLRGGLNRL